MEMGHKMIRALIVILTLAIGLVLTGCHDSSSGDSSLGSVTITPVEPDAPAASVTVNTQISWSIPTTRVLGDFLPLSEIKGYKISYGTSPGSYSDTIIVDGAQQTSADVVLQSGEVYYFVVRAIDTEGLEGPESNTVVRDV